jgi:nucleotide-binding universal stress UspA family protein
METTLRRAVAAEACNSLPLDAAACSILSGGMRAEAEVAGTMGGIVVGIDDSSGARRALAWAVAEAKLHGAALRVIHVHKQEEWSAPLYFPSQHALPGLPTGSVGEPSSTELAGVERAQEILREAARGRAEQFIDALVAEVGAAGIELQPVVVQERHPADALVGESSDADLLVLGSRGRGGFGGLLLGSVTHAVVLHAKCPVVVVP